MSVAPPAPARLGEALGLLRTRRPLVQCLTNAVVAQWTANVLLAAGAVPAMVDNPAEAAGFAALADGVLVNLGTPRESTTAAMSEAVTGAAGAGTPWVLDPVGVGGGLPWRTRIAAQLLARCRPTIIRGNPSEILALAGGQGGWGPESVDTAESALSAARALARTHGTVVAVSGPLDHVTDGTRLVRVANGHPLLTKVTGGGCALGALMAACAGVVDDPMLAAATATAAYTVAAEAAAQTSAGPGSFAVALLDALAALTTGQLQQRVVLP